MKRLISLAAIFIASLGCGSGPQGPSPLLAPSNLMASILSGGVHLTWADNSAEESGFQLERKDPEGQFVTAYSVPFDITQYHDTQVTAGKTYAYRVRATAADRTSDYSNEVSILVKNPGPVSFKSDIVPLINRSCGSTTTGCHARDSYAATANMQCRGWLALEDAALGAKFYSGPMKGQNTGCADRTLYQRLTELAAWGCSNPPRKYVAPKSTAQSQLYQIVAGDPTGGGTCEKSPGVANTRMPPAPIPMLSASEAKLLADWINAGALDN